MDYKYIEQLLERYWACETSLEEERILHTFFSQKDVPASLQRYQEFFAYAQAESSCERLSDDFDAKILSMIQEPVVVKAKTITWRRRLMPLFKAAALVAIILTLGNAAQFSFGGATEDTGIDYAAYQDTYNDPEMAYDKVQNALELVSEGIIQAHQADSMAVQLGTDVNQNKQER